MKVLVTIKRLVDPYAKVKPLPDGSALDTAGTKFEINPFDEIAMEEAVRMREADAGVEIVAVSIGTADAEEQLRKALAIGADRALLIETNATLDPLSVAQELKEVVATESPDLVLMGKQSTDGDSNQVGQMLAAMLDWPQATFAARIERDGAGLRVTRETDAGEEVVALDLPAVVTADLRLNEPRYIALPGIIKARSKPLDRRPAVTASEPLTQDVRYELPPERPAGTRVSSVDELVSALRNRGVLN